MTRHTWTAEQDATLRRMATAKQSASQIAARLGMSRAAVCGRARRLKVQFSSRKPDRAPPPASKPGVSANNLAWRVRQNLHAGNIRGKKESRKSDPVETVARDWRTPDAIAYDATARLLTLLELGPRDCKFPIGDPRDDRFGFCGHRRLPGCPYCPHHEARAAGRVAFVAEAA